MSNTAKGLIAASVMIVSALYIESWIYFQPSVTWWQVPTAIIFFIVGIFGICLFGAAPDFD